MKRSSGTRAFLRIVAGVITVLAALGYYSHVRAQTGGLSDQPMVIPLRPLGALSSVPVPPVFGIEGIVANKSAAIQLGKALFWDMQAGSDDIQACASCHFNAGADSRVHNEVNPAGDSSFQLGIPLNGTMKPNYQYNPGTPVAGFGGYHDGDFPFHKLANPNDRYSVISDVNDVSGSQGIFPLKMGQIIVGRKGPDGKVISSNGSGRSSRNFVEGNAGNHARLSIGSDTGDDRSSLGNDSSSFSSPDSREGGSGSRGNFAGDNVTSIEADNSVPDPVFSYPDPASPANVIDTRRTTGRNTPSTVDAVFNFRNFWDGRAQNVCNGANPFGARDKESHLLVGDAVDGKLGPAFVAMQNSALCSQSLGPILSSTEMSADGRDFHQVGKKLLARKPLAKQMVDPTDSVLGSLSNAPRRGIDTTYSALIEKAFLPQWWQFVQHACVAADGSTAGTINPATASCPANTTDYSQMEYNFSLFWSVAIQMYESTLVADQTPLDKYFEHQITYNLVGDNLNTTFTLHLQPGITPYTVSVIQLDPTRDASDQDIYAFDDGMGRFTGFGMDGTVDYASGTVVVNFENSLASGVPVKVAYSVGPVPLTQGQLRGLELFQTKARCVVCHGGPELSNAAVDTVGPNPLERMVMGDDHVRVYDTGFYHIGVRTGAEDAGLAGTDPVANMPLSFGEEMRQRVCNDSSLSIMIPGRPGDGISQAPLNCSDDIARTGFFKAPQLRNVALTAPYFHNGGQLTLEQVVEFYNRGGDFNLIEELSIMDPDIEPLGLGLTLQEKQDLVDFLRNGLTDPRTVKQAAPFDHPQLFAPNGHPEGPDGYPVQKDKDHPGQATNQFMEIPAVGANGGKPQPTFLENLLGVRNVRPN